MSTMDKLTYQFSETKWNFYMDLMVTFLVSLGMIYYVLTTYTLTGSEITISLLVGWFIFTLIEYMVHAWLFHIGRNILVEGHARHHRKPARYDNLPFFAASLINTALFFIYNLFIDTPLALLAASASLAGYGLYIMYHFLMHRIDFKNPCGKYMQRFHYVHHMRPKKNHGVTTPIWDVIFGTYEPLKKHNLNHDLKARPDEKNIKE